VIAADITGRQEETAKALGDACVAVHVDVTDEASVEAMYATAVETFGKVDAALNVAGLAGAQPLADITLDEYDRLMDVDLKGVMLCTKHAIRTMVQTGGGVILNWSSTGGMNGSRMPTSVYSAAKHGVIAFTKQATIEYGDAGIRANAICPGFIETPMTADLFSMPGMEEVAEGYLLEHALRRYGQPEEIAAAARFLLSSDASFVSGHALAVDGGYTAGRDHGITKMLGLS
jgi:NAD(P)-dependent dehydrogenase (short-subunit alcohol dehydrogenase family)